MTWPCMAQWPMSGKLLAQQIEIIYLKHKTLHNPIVYIIG